MVRTPFLLRSVDYRSWANQYAGFTLSRRRYIVSAVVMAAMVPVNIAKLM